MEKSHQISKVYINGNPHHITVTFHIIRFIQKEGAMQGLQILQTNNFKHTTQEEALSINRLYGGKASDSPSKYKV